jgi:hypothetical protein
MAHAPQVNIGTSRFKTGHSFFEENKLGGGDYDKAGFDLITKKEKLQRTH